MPGGREGCNLYAFEGVPLGRHNAAVGAAVYELFGDRLGAARLGVLRPLGKVAQCLGPGALVQAAVLAGAVHDLGKASPAYPLKGGGYLGHEIVGATLLHEAALELDKMRNIDGALVLELAAYAVARHHAAMKNRHPLDYYNTINSGASKASSEAFRNTLEQGATALEKLASSIDCLVNGLPRVLQGSWVEKLLMNVAKSIDPEASKRSTKPDYIGIVRKTMDELKGLPGWLTGKLSLSSWLGYVWMVSGAVIVADILVANSEGRGTDEGAGPAYVESWRRELGEEKVKRVEELARDQDKAERVLEKALTPLLGLEVPL